MRGQQLSKYVARQMIRVENETNTSNRLYTTFVLRTAPIGHLSAAYSALIRMSIPRMELIDWLLKASASAES